ncbi:4Fe-4S dicluster domain-containing protein [Desulfotignum balticum]|jgi:formate dehydrogenase iron-sulfur subunit|uniref:4Fe-4S dicluster domain-containing protein n=1 Tax=Desulfotignum balticum TaxID=115781 RepID=UPI000428D4D3|nr:4Fe-4S dicluster domain-containing protein [Desulfotignum balticum]
MKSYAILLDTTLCTGCNTCLYKCIQENMGQDAAYRGLFRTIAFIRDPGIYHHRCMHCLSPDCVEVCPEGALTKTDYGPVLYNADLCTGCQTCVDACPFSAPLFDPVTEKIVRCSMCAHRISEGRPPACVEACPTGALVFDEFHSVLATAEKRTARDNLYTYGITQNAGTCFIVLTKNDPMEIGYPSVGEKTVPADRTLSALPLWGVGAVAGGMKLFSDRRARIEAQEKNS